MKKIVDHDIFLFSDQSYSPHALLEAKAAGLPIVAFNRGSTGEFVKDGKDGRVVPVISHNPFRDAYPFAEKQYRLYAKAIEQVANNLSAYENAQLRMLTKRQLAHFALSYHKLLTRLISVPRAVDETAPYVARS